MSKIEKISRKMKFARKSNNWLKMHGYPMRRGKKCKEKAERLKSAFDTFIPAGMIIGALMGGYASSRVLAKLNLDLTGRRKSMIDELIE